MTRIEQLRLFVAVEVPEDQRRAVQTALAPARDDLAPGRWLPIENQHLTLKFLGTTPMDRLGAVEEVCATVARSHEPDAISLDGLGAFPSRKRARVLWVGVDDPRGLLARMAGDLARAFEPLGYREEKRAFTAHLTLARFKVPGRLPETLPELPEDVLRPFRVERLALFRSALHPSGARYELMATFPLGSEA